MGSNAVVQRVGSFASSLHPYEFGYLSPADVCLGRNGFFFFKNQAKLLPDSDRRPKRDKNVLLFRLGEGWYLDTNGTKRTFHKTDPPGRTTYTPAEGRVFNLESVQTAALSEASKTKERAKTPPRQVQPTTPKKPSTPKPAQSQAKPAPAPRRQTKQQPQPSWPTPAATQPAGKTVAVAERRTVTVPPVQLGKLARKQERWLDLSDAEWWLDDAGQAVRVKVRRPDELHRLYVYSEPGDDRILVKKDRGVILALVEVPKKRRPQWLPLGPG